MTYKDIAYILWGAVPIDKEWAINTLIYKEFIKTIKL